VSWIASTRFLALLWGWEPGRDVCALIEGNCIYAQEDAGLYRNTKARMNLIYVWGASSRLYANLGHVTVVMDAYICLNVCSSSSNHYLGLATLAFEARRIQPWDSLLCCCRRYDSYMLSADPYPQKYIVYRAARHMLPDLYRLFSAKQS